MIKQLPIYTYNGIDCNVDFKLRELRPLDAPHEAIPFTTLNKSAKSDVRGIRAEFWGVMHIPELDN